MRPSCRLLLELGAGLKELGTNEEPTLTKLNMTLFNSTHPRRRNLAKNLGT